ncbi:MAG: hypothetical protein MZV63_33900 [Marinilabiliales bacterium]|nr:hypothetical protein [Marinilabiliales bacterium]
MFDDMKEARRMCLPLEAPGAFWHKRRQADEIPGHSKRKRERGVGSGGGTETQGMPKLGRGTAFVAERPLFRWSRLRRTYGAFVTAAAYVSHRTWKRITT